MLVSERNFRLVFSVVVVMAVRSPVATVVPGAAFFQAAHQQRDEEPGEDDGRHDHDSEVQARAISNVEVA
jgi:hypothetical protein